MRENEDYSPKDSTSDSSEKLGVGGGQGQYICDFGEGGIHAINHIFFQVSAILVKLSAIHET